MHVVLITPLVDPHDPLLGFIHTWVERLAARVDRLSVIQLWKSDPPLPANVDLYSLDRNGVSGKVTVLGRLTTTLARLCWREHVDGVLTHMGPIFAVCAAPIVKPARIPLALWYAHGAVSPTLRLAYGLVDRVGTSTPDGFRIRGPKVTITGQGIDTDRFRPAGDRDNQLIVSVGRISPVKHYEQLVSAVACLRNRGMNSVRLRIVGGATLASEQAYRERLISQIAELSLAPQVEIVPGVPHERVAQEYQRAAIFASCSQTGSLDKAVLEAASAGALPITSNPALDTLFKSNRADHMPRFNEPEAVADLIASWLNRTPGERAARAAALRERVISEHGVDHLADELVKLVRPLQASPAPRTATSENGQ